MINDLTDGYLDQVKRFAERTGQTTKLDNQLAYLSSYGCHGGRVTRCNLMRDFAPESFYFVMDVKQEDQPDDCYMRWFCGGLIFHGAHDNGGDGGGPTFSVNLTPQDGWSVHT